MSLLQTVTARGTFYYIDGKRVSRDAAISAKFQKRLSCFITRVSKNAVRNWCTIN